MVDTAFFGQDQMLCGSHSFQSQNRTYGVWTSPSATNLRWRSGDILDSRSCMRKRTIFCSEFRFYSSGKAKDLEKENEPKDTQKNWKVSHPLSPLDKEDKEEKSVDEYKNAPPPPENPITTNEVQMHASSFNVPWRSREDFFSWRIWKEFANETRRFYWNGTKVLWRRFNEARQLKHDIRMGRAFQRANRREFLFIQSAYKDMMKLVPYAFMGIAGSTFLIGPVGWLLPSSLPSVFQTPSYQITRDIHRNEIRNTEANRIHSILKHILEKEMPTSRKEDYIECLDELQRTNQKFIEHPDKHARTFLQQRMEMLELLSEFRDVYSDRNLIAHRPLLVQRLTSFWGVENPLTWMLVGQWIKSRYLERRFRQLKSDDHLVREFTTEAMRREELVEALYMRGFDIKGYEEFFSFVQLSDIMNAWLRFSERTSNSMLYMLAGPLMVFQNTLPSRTSISPSVQQMHAKHTQDDDKE